MPDYPSAPPPASWYPDPAGAPAERWWDGTQWSEHLRAVPTAAPVIPATAPVAAPIPQFASVGVAFPEYAWTYDKVPAASAPLGVPLADRKTDVEEYRAMASHEAGGAFGRGRFASQGVALPNPDATRSLVFGLIAVTFNLLWIPMILAWVYGRRGLQSANFSEAHRRIPVGRTKARWGIALGVVALVYSALAAWAGLAFYFGGQGYNERAFESALTAEFAQQGVAVKSVDCPANGSFAYGAIVDCRIGMTDGTSMIMRYTMQGFNQEPKAVAVKE